jgi:hypothetical protein
LLSRLFGTRLQRSKNLYFVTLNGQRFKRLILRDSYLADEIEQNLERFGASEHFPRLVIRYEHEIWVEFIDGTGIKTVDEHVVKKMADFYAAVYARRPRYMDTVESPFLYRLHRDLGFLNQVGVLANNVYRELNTTAERLTPKRVWVGFDYSDPVLKNFVITRDGGRLCAVDVEGLVDNQLMGMGVAKASMRWLGPFVKVFFDHLARKEVPDFQSYFPFVELCFLAKWTKRNFFEKKWKVVNPTLFERFRHL